MSRLDRTLKTVWLVIGALVLAVLVVGGVGAGFAFLTAGGGGADQGAVPAAAATGQGDAALPVRYGVPQPVPGGPYRVAEVRAAVPEDGVLGSAGGEYALVNLAFVAPDGGRGHLLLDRPARIESFLLPREGDTARTWIAYEIAFRDTDGDRRLTRADARTLYVSDAAGRALRPVLPDGYRYLTQAPLAGGRILVLALQAPADTTLPTERWRERALAYDVATGRLAPYAALDSLAARAGQLLGR